MEERNIKEIAKDFVVNVLAERVAQVYYKNKLVKTFPVSDGDDWCHIDICETINGNKLVDLNVYYVEDTKLWHATIYQVALDSNGIHYSTLTDLPYYQVDCYAIRENTYYHNVYKVICSSKERILIPIGMFTEVEAEKVVEDRLAQERAEGYIEDELGWINEDDRCFIMELHHKNNEADIILYFNETTHCLVAFYERGYL